MSARGTALGLLALGVAAACWLAAEWAAPVLGSDAFWPLDRLLAVIAGLAALEKVLTRAG